MYPEQGFWEGNSQSPEFSQSVLPCLDYLDELAVREPQARPTRCIVIGDLVLDVFYQISETMACRESGKTRMVSSKAPIVNLGGAGNVLRGLAPFSREVTLVGAIGTNPCFQSELGLALQGLQNNVNTLLIPMSGQSTPTVVRFFDDKGQVQTSFEVRPDRWLNQAELCELSKLTTLILSNARSVDIRPIICDYGRGVCSQDALLKISKCLNGHNPIIDPRPGSDMSKYNMPRATLKPNRQEAAILSGINLSGPIEELEISAQQAAERIFELLPSLKSLLITLDKDGALSVENHGSKPTWFGPSFPHQDIRNPSGAGDVVSCALALLTNPFGAETAIKTGLALAEQSVTMPGTSTLDSQLVQLTRTALTTS
jgi:bifunctional ADP-heptose synthase (sugar kinase/adenylyltransferase)